ncbi:unnamed protein product [Caenorhabditis bovis]|uniref:Bax inhibitor-1/YccA family protein n=1 Tax=Caenorhabditis bovis TaxID=2654633 RepID=A0A8S1E8W6_9PELO|nr:unnamed protein product [Caenorhabditis bovis]
MEENEHNSKYNIHFTEQSIRTAFIQKVFSLVTIMFAIVAALSAIPIASPEFRLWCQQNTILYFLSLVVFIIFVFVITCFPSLRRSFPANMIVLLLFTLSAGVTTMFVTAQYSVDSVLLALIITTLCSAGIIIIATSIKQDLTTCLGVAAILGIFLMIFGLVAIIAAVFFHSPILYLIYSGLGALLMMFYLAIDVQLLMGNRKFEFTPEDYIMASVQLFLDILNLFLFILNLVGGR